MDNKYYIKKETGWQHRPPLKVIINPILRKLQWFTDKPFVIASWTEFVNGEPKFICYRFKRVKYLKNETNRIHRKIK